MPSVDVWIALPQVSKFHAFVVTDLEDRLTIADANSKNGTWVNGAKLPVRQAVPLVDGARVRFGPHEFLFLTLETFRAAVARGRLD